MTPWGSPCDGCCPPEVTVPDYFEDAAAAVMPPRLAARGVTPAEWAEAVAAYPRRNEWARCPMYLLSWIPITVVCGALCFACLESNLSHSRASWYGDLARWLTGKGITVKQQVCV